MEYKGYEITYIQPCHERQGIDDKGNPIEWLDAWHSGNGWYSADKMGEHESEITASDFDRIKTLIDRELAK